MPDNNMPEHILERLKRFLQGKPTEQALKGWMSQLPPEEHAECALFMLRSSPTTYIRVFRPEHAFRNPEKLTDEELLRELAKSVDDSAEVKNGKIAMINPRDNPEPVNRFASLVNEAVRRGLTREEIFSGMRPFSEDAHKFDSVFPKDPEWKRFERIVARIHAAFFEGAEVQWSEKRDDHTGRTRQIDVSIRHKAGPYGLFIIVECKHEKRPVSIEEVEAFVTKKGDLKANLAIMVSSNGFQQGAKAKAAFHDVRLWTLEEAEKISWREESRTVRLFYHMFDSIDFYPRVPSQVAFEGSALPFDGVFVQTPTRRLSLQQIALHAIHNATEQCLPIPCFLDCKYEAGSRLQWSGDFPIERISFHFVRRILVELEKSVRVPTGTVYKYSQADGTPSFTWREADLPQL